MIDGRTLDVTIVTHDSYDKTEKSLKGVMPADFCIQNILKILDIGFRRDDGKSEFRPFA